MHTADLNYIFFWIIIPFVILEVKANMIKIPLIKTQIQQHTITLQN